MKKQIKESDVREFYKQGSVMAVLMIVMMVSPIPLVRIFDWFGFAVWGVFAVIVLIYGFKAEKWKKQQDILLWQTGSREYAGLHFYSVDFSGKYIPVPKDLLLVLRFLSCRVDQGDIDRFSASGGHQYLLGTFDEALSPADLQRLAEAFAAKHSLSLIRGQNKTALFRKKTVPPR